MTQQPDPTPAVLARALRHAVRFLRDLDRAPVAAAATVAGLRARLGRAFPERETDALTVTDELVADSEGGHDGSAGGRFFGWVIGRSPQRHSAPTGSRRRGTRTRGSAPAGRPRR